MSEYEVDRGALRRCGLDGADLAAILRQHGRQGPHDVHLAIFEAKGAVSVLPGRLPQQARGIVEETAPPEDGGRDPQPAVEREAVTDARPQHMARERLGTGLSRGLHGTATAFGYSVRITASFGAVQLDRGQPHYADLLLYGLGAVTAFGALEGAVTKGFRGALAVGSDQVISLGTALSPTCRCARSKDAGSSRSCSSARPRSPGHSARSACSYAGWQTH